MTGLGVVILILAVIGLAALLYFGAWCLFSVQRNHKEGHYILESDVEADDNEIFNKKPLYSGLDMVDEAKESSYVKNHLDLDSINENTTVVVKTITVRQDDGMMPSAPQDNQSSSSNSSNNSQKGDDEEKEEKKKKEEEEEEEDH